MLDHEEDNLPNFLKNVDKKASPVKTERKRKNDRTLYEDSPGQYMGIEHYISSNVRKQRGQFNLDSEKVGIKT